MVKGTALERENKRKPKDPWSPFKKVSLSRTTHWSQWSLQDLPGPDLLLDLQTARTGDDIQADTAATAGTAADTAGTAANISGSSLLLLFLCCCLLHLDEIVSFWHGLSPD